MIKEKYYANVTCVKCGKEFKLYADGTSNMTKCKKCYAEIEKKEKEVRKLLETARKMEKDIQLEKKRKQLEGKDPYEVLAHLKLMLHRSKNKRLGDGWWVSSGNLNPKDSILKECEDILEAYDIPSKYLIAETLDSKDE